MLFYMIVVGALAGFLAKRMMQLETGVLATIGIGIAGAILGWVLLKLLLAVIGLVVGLIGAVFGALILIGIWRAFVEKR